MATTSELSENLAASIDSAVRSYCEDIGRDDPTAKGNGFTIWCLTELFGFDRGDALDAIVDGKGDRSIDAAIDDGNRLIVIQSKYNTHRWAEITKTHTDLAQVFAGEKNLPARIRPVAAQIRDRLRDGLPVDCFYITNEVLTADDSSKVLGLPDAPRLSVMDLDAIRDHLRERASDRPLSAPDKPVHLRASVHELPFSDSLIASVGLVEFARFVGEGERWLFESNVRQYLSRSTINKGIRNTVRNEADRFWRYNNGVTIVVDDYAAGTNGVIALTKPQIVNGCQTSLAIKTVVSELDQEERAAIDGHVLLRIVREPSDDERRKITEFTNRQNSVKGKDFFALKNFQRSLKASIDSLGYFYEIQAGSFDMLSASEKDRLHGDGRYSHLKWSKRNYRVPAIEAAKCHAAAFHGKVSVCYANPGELAPNGSLYDVIFPNDLPDEPEPFLLPFLLMKHAEQEFGYGASKGEAWRRRGRYMFVFTLFLLISEVLRRAGRLADGEELGPQQMPLVRELVADEEMVARLVEAADQAMDGFFSDSVIDKMVNDDIFAFLKNGIEKKESLNVLDLKVRHELAKPRGRTTVERVQALLPA